MTSVIDNPGKVAEYIYSCKEMGMKTASSRHKSKDTETFL